MNLIEELEKQLLTGGTITDYGFYDEYGVWCWYESAYGNCDWPDDFDIPDDLSFEMEGEELEKQNLHEDEGPSIGKNGYDPLLDEWYSTEDDYVEFIYHTEVEYNIDYPDDLSFEMHGEN